MCSYAQEDAYVFMQARRTRVLTLLKTKLARDERRSKTIIAFVGLDTMSTDTFVSSKIVNALKLPLYLIKGGATCKGLGTQATKIRHFTELIVGEGKHALHVEALVVPSIGQNLTYVPPEWSEGDDQHAQQVDMDLLLNVVHTWQIITRVEMRKHNDQTRAVIRTKLGDCGAGEFSIAEPDGLIFMSNRDLERAFERFHSLESVGISCGPDDERKAEEVEAERIIQLKAKLKDKVWTVPILFKPEARVLRNNYKMAERRLIALERRLALQPELRPEYYAEIKALFDRGDARILRPEEIETPVAYYMPHRPVLRPEHETTKIRPVFDASAKNQDGISLNTEILTPPVTHPPLTGILMRFRQKRIALTADISKMFYRILVPEEHQKYQRFLFRYDPSEPIQHAAHVKTAFGRADSPYNASKVVKMQIELDQRKYPAAAAELSKNLYVDDLLTGTDTVSEALNLHRECVALLDGASLQLRKWCSNSLDVLQQIPEHLRGEKAHVLLTGNLTDEAEIDGEKAAISSALGVEWNVEEDTLRFSGFAKMTLTVEGCTKRSVTSNVCKFFDPLGLISPFIVTAKVLVQSTWKRQIGWDELLPEDMRQVWQKWVAGVPLLDRMEIPRCIRVHVPPNAKEEVMLIVFSDASELALGAAVYIRISYGMGRTETHLLMSKSRVAPLKELTLPRKELVAALMGARLLKHVAEELEMKTSDAICFSDSMTALQWMRKPPRTWKQYVANRVQQIQEITTAEQWRHVAGPDNPADLPSRGTTTADLVGNELWFKGPRWLHRPVEEWPREGSPIPSNACLEEARGPGLEDDEVIALVAYEVNETHDSLWRLPWRRLLGVTARLFRLARGKKDTPNSLDLHEARMYWLRRDQRRFLADTIQRLERGEPLRTGDSLRRLGVKLDENGFLVAEGRLQHSLISEEMTYPIILPKIVCKSLTDTHSTATARLIYDTHAYNQHAGADWLLQHLRQRYWILSGRRTIRSVIRHCVRCQIATKGPMKQRMAPLPFARLHTSIPWAYVGVDHAGPFRIRCETEDTKGYIVIFTDLVSRGVHFEFVPRRDTESFFEAFRQFISRRGTPFELYSDQAREFERARKELIGLYELVDPDKLKAGLAQMGILWRLNVPYSPHRGGVWERMLRTFKESLRKAIGTRVLTERQLRLYTAEIEAMMNDRPLCVPASGKDITEAITPSLIMNGRRLRYLPGAPKPPFYATDDAAKAAEKWKARQTLMQHAWRHFSTTYMKEVLTRIPKWTDEQEAPLAVGDIVLIGSEVTERGQWPWARVVDIHDGPRTRDGRVRTVTVEKSNGQQYVRSIQQLVRLELEYPKPKQHEAASLDAVESESDGSGDRDDSTAGENRDYV